MGKGKQIYKLPEGWIWTTIGEIAVLSSGGTPSRANSNYFRGYIPLLRYPSFATRGKLYWSLQLLFHIPFQNYISIENLHYKCRKCQSLVASEGKKGTLTHY